MTVPMTPQDPVPPPRDADNRVRPRVDAGQLWPGGIATAIVAALVALVGILVCRWLFGVPILSPKQDGAYGSVHTTAFVIAAAVAAIIATAIAHLLLLSTPRPLTFFHWIVGLVTVVVVLFPFSTSAPLSEKVATAAVDLVIGLAIGSLITGVAARSLRRTAVRRDEYTTTVRRSSGPSGTRPGY
ncbi:MAG TPA: DUF6069 family protein [Streptosporangiaceae bacterium]|nr:DUF6069 family protein [Streptosporangiaceae bacterium]